MSLRGFLALSTITAIAVAAAVFVIAERDSALGGASRALMFPGLMDRLEEVATIKVTHADGEATIERKAKAWVVKEASSYPADMEKVREVLIGLAQIETVEPKTKRADRYAKLEVEDATGKDAKSARVTLTDAKGGTLADLIVGKTKFSLEGIDSLYVRRPGEERAWLARGRVEPARERLGWVDQSFLSIGRERIRKATLRRPGSPPLVVFKDKAGDEDFKLAGMPPGTEIKDEFAVSDIARVLQGMTFDDVRPVADVPVDQGGEPYGVYETFDGLIFDLWLGEADGKTWLAGRAKAGTDPAPTEEVKKEIEEINTRLGTWRYALAEYELKNLKKTMADLVTKKEETKEGADKTPAGEPAK
ncbi:MAG: DUF4340 domain-containing protein [Proteobacteria bacterium]|nr:DUF4340 domain-containing protein [Pseudomonadota bacterium]